MPFSGIVLFFSLVERLLFLEGISCYPYSMLEKKLQIKPSFKQFIIDKLKLANPVMKMSVSTYFTSDQSETFTKIEEVDDKILYKEITPGEHGFVIIEKRRCCAPPKQGNLRQRRRHRDF